MFNPKIIYAFLLLLAFPLATLGQAWTTAPGTLGAAMNTIFDIVSTIVPIVMVLALIYFFWGLAKYILSAGDEEGKSKGKSIMVWGVIALFVMASVWGLVLMLQKTFDVDREAPVVVPKVPRPAGPS